VVTSKSDDTSKAGSVTQDLSGSTQKGLGEGDGLVLLRLTYLELIGERAAYLNLAMTGRQWDCAIGAMLRSGDR
jgi:hypothetical protein